MRNEFVQIENFAFNVVYSLAPRMLPALALKRVDGKLVAAETFVAAAAFEIQ